MLAKPTLNIFFFLIIGLLVPNKIHAQTDYIIDARININEQSLIVSQTLNFKNSFNRKINKIYLIKSIKTLNF